MAKSGQVTITRNAARTAESYLAARDQKMAVLIVRHGACQLPNRKATLFETLACSIIGQQLSAKAADCIERRVRQLIGENLSASDFLTKSICDLRSSGLSRPKATYLKEIAQRINDGKLDLHALRNLSDAEVVVALSELPGVGQWTAEMFLIFALKRPDVFSLGDAGLRRAVRSLYGETEIESFSLRWQPYRSVASWYLWRYIDRGEPI